MGDDRGSEALAREPDRLKLSPVRQIRVVYGDVFLPVQIADVLGGGGAHGRVMIQSVGYNRYSLAVPLLIDLGRGS